MSRGQLELEHRPVLGTAHPGRWSGLQYLHQIDQFHSCQQHFHDEVEDRLHKYHSGSAAEPPLTGGRSLGLR